MAVVCPKCGVENRDKARFCLGCAAPLDLRQDAEPPVEPADRPRAARSAGAGRRAQRARQARRKRVVWFLCLALAVALGAALLAGRAGGGRPHQQEVPAASPTAATPPAPSATPAEAPASLPAPASPVPVDAAAPAPSPQAVSAAERLRASVEDLAQRDRVHQQALDLERKRLVLEMQKAQEPRRSADYPVGPRPVAAAPAATPLPEAGAAAPAAVSPTVLQPLPSVDQLCASSGNFLARDLCRLRECGKPGFAGDPVCVRFREMDEARRRQTE
jgi:hypothetical protein